MKKIIMKIKRTVDIKKITETLTKFPIYIVKGVDLKYIEEFPNHPYSDFSYRIRNLIEEIVKGKYTLYKAFSPMEFRSVVEKGIDTQYEYIIEWALEKVMRDNIRELFKEYGLACLAMYDAEKLEKTDPYTYRPKTSFLDAFLGIICFSDLEFSRLHEKLLWLELLVSKMKKPRSKN